MRPRIAWIAVGIAAAATIVAVAAVLLVTGNDDHGAPVESRVRPGGPGFVWLDGEWLEPPYDVRLDGRRITINGAVVRERAERSMAVPPPLPVEPPDAMALVQVAHARFQALGGASEAPPDDATIAALRDELLQFSVTADVRYEPPVLVIEDTDGESAALILQVPTPPPLSSSSRTNCSTGAA